MKAKLSLPGHSAELELGMEEIKSFFDGIIPQSVKEGGGIITDTVKFWRFKNQVVIVEKANKIIKDNNLQKHQVPLKVLVPLLESASLEQEETLQEMWSNLLVNATTKEESVRPIFISILKEISAIEARVINRIYTVMAIEVDDLFYEFEKEGYAKEHLVIALDNLRRLNLCRNKTYQGTMQNRLLTALEQYNFPFDTYYSHNTVNPFIDVPTDAPLGKDDGDKLQKRIERLEKEQEDKESTERKIELTPLAIAVLQACSTPNLESRK